MERNLPVMQVSVRVFYAAEEGDPTRYLEIYRSHFDEAAALWKREAGIELVLQKNKIQRVFDDDIAQPESWFHPLDALHEPGLGCITVVYVQNLPRHDGTAGSLHRAKTYFSQPNIGRFGYGVVLDKNRDPTAADLAHELGHALGLPHTTSTAGSGFTGVDGLSEAERALDPYPDDTVDARSNNLMGDNTDDLAATDTELTDSQVKRARLTIATRVCPFARFFQSDLEAEYIPSDNYPLLDDVSARFVILAF